MISGDYPSLGDPVGAQHLDVSVDRHRFVVSGDGLRREYWIHRPADRPPADLGVIVDLHGSGESPATYARTNNAFHTAAGGYAVVMPAAVMPFTLIPGSSPGTAWNIPGSPLPGQADVTEGPNDVAFLSQLLRHLHRHHGFDPARIHLRGYSGGARLASHLVGLPSVRVASLCAVAGVRFPHSPAPATPPAILAIHGMKDDFNPYDGGIPERWDAGVETVVDQWASAWKCDRRVSHPAAPEVIETRYVSPDGTEPVRLISLSSGGHAWPGSTDDEHQRRFGPAGRFSASRASLEFIREIDSDTSTSANVS